MHDDGAELEPLHGLAEDVARLKSKDYRAVRDDPIFIKFTHMVHTIFCDSSVRIVCVMAPLVPDEVKYHVTEDSAKFYGAAPGTPLNLIWLLDCALDAENMTQEEFVKWEQDYYVDCHRYSFMRPSQKEIFDLEKRGNDHIIEEWGNLIVGFAPLYTVEGTFVGTVNVDFDISEYDMRWRDAYFKIVAAFCITFCVMAASLFYAYHKYWTADIRAKYRDALTGVYNRRYEMERFASIKAALETDGAPYAAVVMMDLDHFKAINDTYGHKTGDGCLRAFASACAGALAAAPNIIIRWGGEEFIILTPCADGAALEAMLAKLTHAVRGCVPPPANAAEVKQGDKVPFTVSAGGVLCALREMTPHSLETAITEADALMYRAKREGRDRYCVG